MTTLPHAAQVVDEPGCGYAGCCDVDGPACIRGCAGCCGLVVVAAAAVVVAAAFVGVSVTTAGILG